MNRRSFLKSLGVALAASSVPIGAARAARLPVVKPEVSQESLSYLREILELQQMIIDDFNERLWKNFWHGDPPNGIEIRNDQAPRPIQKAESP